MFALKQTLFFIDTSLIAESHKYVLKGIEINVKNDTLYMKKLIISFISLTFLSHAQNESNIWYFGQNAGLDFSTGTPVALTKGMVSTTEGVATLCNEKGELLFYTDGVTVRNSKHDVMKNGEGLKGDPSSTQSAVAILKPNTKNIYYLFTVAASGNKAGLTYSIIDMNLESGLGGITKKIIYYMNTQLKK